MDRAGDPVDLNHYLTGEFPDRSYHGIPYQSYRSNDHVRDKLRDDALSDALDERTGPESPRIPQPYHRRIMKTWVERHKTQLLHLMFGLRNRTLAIDKEDWLRYAESIARARVSDFPNLLFQYILRQDQAPFAHNGTLDEKLPNEEEWEKMLAEATRGAGTVEELERYSYILRGDTHDARLRRWLADTSSHPTAPPKPKFLLRYVIRRSAHFSSTQDLLAVMDQVQDYARHITRVSRQTSGPDGLKRAHQRLTALIQLLLHHACRLEPRLVINVVDIAVETLDDLSRPHGGVGKPWFYKAQCDIFNKAIEEFHSPSLRLPLMLGSIPNEYIWQAQRMLLNKSAEFDKPLMLSRQAFLAIRSALAGLPHSEEEAHIARRHAATWPPYVQSGDGIDEQSRPEDNWSRVVQAGTMMQEAGYPLTETDVALDILQGRASDGTPTIRQRVAVDHSFNRRAWVAEIRATRSAREAWYLFDRPPTKGTKRGNDVYAAMYLKLAKREAKSRAEAEDPVHSLTEVSAARRRPPTIRSLYFRMLGEGIKPASPALEILLENARNLEIGHAILGDAEDQTLLPALKSDQYDPQLVQRIPPSVFKAYLKLLCKNHSDGLREDLSRVIKLMQARLPHLSPADEADCWAIVLQKVRIHHATLKMTVWEQLGAVLDIWTYIEDSRGFLLGYLSRFCKAVRVIMERQASQLFQAQATGYPDTLEDHFLYTIYSTTEATKDALPLPTLGAPSLQTSSLTLWACEKTADRVKQTFHKLVQDEKTVQDMVCKTPAHASIAPLDRMRCRRDPVNAQTATSYMMCLASLGEYEEMAWLARWLMEQWGDPKVMEAILGLDEPPPEVDLRELLCVYRLVAEPMLPQEQAESLKHEFTNGPLAWLWPEDEALTAYYKVADETRSIGQVLRLHGRVRNAMGKPGPSIPEMERQSGD